MSSNNQKTSVGGSSGAGVGSSNSQNEDQLLLKKEQPGASKLRFPPPGFNRKSKNKASASTSSAITSPTISNKPSATATLTSQDQPSTSRSRSQVTPGNMVSPTAASRRSTLTGKPTVKSRLTPVVSSGYGPRASATTNTTAKTSNSARSRPARAPAASNDEPPRPSASAAVRTSRSRSKSKISSSVTKPGAAASTIGHAGIRNNNKVPAGKGRVGLVRASSQVTEEPTSTNKAGLISKATLTRILKARSRELGAAARSRSKDPAPVPAAQSESPNPEPKEQEDLASSQGESLTQSPDQVVEVPQLQVETDNINTPLIVTEAEPINIPLIVPETEPAQPQLVSQVTPAAENPTITGTTAVELIDEELRRETIEIENDFLNLQVGLASLMNQYKAEPIRIEELPAGDSMSDPEEEFPLVGEPEGPASSSSDPELYSLDDADIQNLIIVEVVGLGKPVETADAVPEVSMIPEEEGQSQNEKKTARIIGANEDQPEPQTVSTSQSDIPEAEPELVSVPVQDTNSSSVAVAPPTIAQDQYIYASTVTEYFTDPGLTISEIKEQIKTSKTFSIIRDISPLKNSQNLSILSKNQDQELDNLGDNPVEELDCDKSSQPADLTNPDFLSFLELLKANPKVFSAIAAASGQDEDFRLPTNTPEAITSTGGTSSSSVSASTIVSYQQYENYKSLRESRALVKKIRSRSTPNAKSSRNSSRESSNTDLSSSSGEKPSEENGRLGEKLSKRKKTQWLLFRKGIESISGESQEKVEPTMENITSIFGEGSDSDDSDYNEQKELGRNCSERSDSELGSKSNSSSSEKIGIDQIEQPNPSGETSSISSEDSMRINHRCAQYQLKWIENVASFNIQKKYNQAPRCNFFFGITLPNLFRGPMFPSSDYSSNRPAVPSRTSISLYNIYQDSEAIGLDDGVQTPSFTVHESSSSVQVTSSNIAIAQGGVPLAISAGGPALRLIINSVPVPVSDFVATSESSPEVEASLDSIQDEKDSQDSNNNAKPMLILNCTDCTSPDCTLHSIDVIVSNGGPIKLGTVNFLSCDKEHPVLILQNEWTRECFIVRTRNYVTGFKNADFHVHQTVDLKDEDYPKDEFDESKDGPCIGSFSRRFPMDDGQEEEFPNSIRNEATETLVIKFSGSLTSETKALLLSGAILLNHDILQS